MKRIAVVLLSVLPAAAPAHPGHGKLGFLHSHDLTGLLASGALALGALAVVGACGWAVLRAWRRHRLSEAGEVHLTERKSR